MIITKAGLDELYQRIEIHLNKLKTYTRKQTHQGHFTYLIPVNEKPSRYYKLHVLTESDELNKDSLWFKGLKLVAINLPAYNDYYVTTEYLLEKKTTFDNQGSGSIVTLLRKSRFNEEMEKIVKKIQFQYQLQEELYSASITTVKQEEK